MNTDEFHPTRIAAFVATVLWSALSPPAIGQERPPENANAATLPGVFVDLADLSDTTNFGYGFEWSGLSLTSPVQARYSLELRDGQFVGEGKFSVATATATCSTTVPRSVVQAFLAAASRVSLDEKKYSPRITHTDDYPSLTVYVRTKQGLLLISTASQGRRPPSGNYVDRTPWAVEYMGRTFVVTASDLDQSMEELERHLQKNELLNKLADEVRSRNPPR